MSEETELPQSIGFGELQIGSVTLRCHMLDNGQRVIEKEGIEQLFSEDFGLTPEMAEQIVRFIRGEQL